MNIFNRCKFTNSISLCQEIVVRLKPRLTN